MYAMHINVVRDGGMISEKKQLSNPFSIGGLYILTLVLSFGCSASPKLSVSVRKRRSVRRRRTAAGDRTPDL